MSSQDNPRGLYRFVEMPGKNRLQNPLSSPQYSDERDSDSRYWANKKSGICDCNWHSLCLCAVKFGSINDAHGLDTSLTYLSPEPLP